MDVACLLAVAKKKKKFVGKDLFHKKNVTMIKSGILVRKRRRLSLWRSYLPLVLFDSQISSRMCARSVVNTVC